MSGKLGKKRMFAQNTDFFLASQHGKRCIIVNNKGAARKKTMDIFKYKQQKESILENCIV